MNLRYFGTDGIRDAVGGPLLEEGFVRRLGCAVGRHIRRRAGDKPLHVVVGRDTRASGSALSTWLAEGLEAAGVRLFDGGIVPTPAVALAVRELDLEGGLVVTASHNPSTDNGIKLFGPGGLKLSEHEESAVEQLVDGISEIPRPARPPASFGLDARRHYKQFLGSLLPENSLAGLLICVDSANGATAYTTPEVLESYGATVVRLHGEPDGHNINAACGSEHPASLCESVRAHGAFLGIAHDGDGDRAIFVDETGAVVPGDVVIGLLARHLKAANRLTDARIIATIMSNAGLESSLRREGISMERTPVGDRHVLHALLSQSASFGGENSGHLIIADRLAAGDGCLAALELLAALRTRDESLAQARAAFPLFPQKLLNRRVAEKIPFDSIPRLSAELDGVSRKLGERGRILVRYSGTEPKIRLLVEAASMDLVDSTLRELEALVAEHLQLTD